jgi:hypothetical protein
MQIIDKPLQFGIRHLLGAMFVVSLVAALIAPWVRAWSAQQWLILGIETGLEVLTFAIYVQGHVWLRNTWRGRLGEIFFRVPVRIEGSDLWNPVNAYVSIVLATIMLTVVTASTIIAKGDFGEFFIYGPIAGFCAAMGLTQLWHPPKEAFVGEHGIALVGRFIPWDKLWCGPKTCTGSTPPLLRTAGWTFELFPDGDIVRPLADYVQRRTKP